jgi:hypothetical protein
MQLSSVLIAIGCQAVVSSAIPVSSSIPSETLLAFNAATPPQDFSMAVSTGAVFTISNYSAPNHVPGTHDFLDNTNAVSSIQSFTAGVQCAFFGELGDTSIVSTNGAEIAYVGPPSVLTNGVCLSSA